MINFIYL